MTLFIKHSTLKRTIMIMQFIYLGSLCLCILIGQSLCDRKLINSKSNGDSMIVNGELVQSGEANYQLVLLRIPDNIFICGASLISNRTALTAAHCVYEIDQFPEQFAIRHSTLVHSQGPIVAVLRIVMHPAFTLKSFNYDLAILTLESRISSETVELITIANEEPSDGSKLLVTGWGQTSGPIGPTSEQLLRGELTKMNQDECVQRWGSGQPVTNNMFCASSVKQSSCKGDSGGPVTQNGTLVGVVSWGSAECLHEQLPNVFVNLAKSDIRQWIDLNMID